MITVIDKTKNDNLRPIQNILEAKKSNFGFN